MSANPTHASAPPLPIGFVEQNSVQMYPPPSADQSGPPPPYPWAEMQQPKNLNSPPPQYEAPPPSAYPALPNQHYPSTAATSNHFHQQHQQQYVPPPAPVMNISVNRILQGNCRHCHAGMVISRSDTCCVVCLIVMTILTFPFGLVFLCCLPCAVEQRCNVCHRRQ
uniref:Membrane protein BRI3 n=1 Tax=Plectus sambesii TaxID=2011161 RepID=A0A914XAS5_9BILA